VVLGDAAGDEVRALRVCVEGAAMNLREWILDTGDGLIPVRRAIARCGHCEWMVIMSGDDDAEIAEFLRLLLHEHVTDLHPGGIHE
jgi:hypothetical protein